jgi:hypothetical protein
MQRSEAGRRDDNAVADYLSKLESGEAPAGVADDFPDSGVMMLSPVS